MKTKIFLIIAIFIISFTSISFAEEFEIYYRDGIVKLDIKNIGTKNKLRVIDIDISRLRTDEEKVKVVVEGLIKKELGGYRSLVYKLKLIEHKNEEWYLFYEWGIGDEDLGHIFNAIVSLKNHNVIYERCM